MKYRPPNLVSRDDAYGYPTNFSAMSDAWIDKLSTRGEQITHALIREHAPQLLSPNEGRANS